MNLFEDAEKQAAFEELKTAITKAYGPEVAEDDRIRRFLIARDFNVKHAKTMLEKHLEWRKRNKIDTILKDFTMPEVFKNYFPMSLIGVDLEGSPIFVISANHFDYKGFQKASNNKEMIRCAFYLVESAVKIMRENPNKNADNQNYGCIIDLTNISLGNVTTKTEVERFIEIVCICEANYPETFKINYIINASTYFYIIFNVLKPLMSEKTVQKVKVFGKDGWKEELLKVIDPDVLPAYLGGKRTDSDGNPLCRSVVCQGGVIPKRFYKKKNSDNNDLRNKPGVKSHVLKRRSKLNLSFDVQTIGAFIEWDIETDGFDIGFGLSFKKSIKDESETQLIPIQRVNSHVFCETGTFKCDNPGTYILTLDNSYSVLRPKHIYYRVLVAKPKEKEFTAQE